jgi:hypothetical protein
VIYAGVPLSAAPGADGADIGAVELASPPAPSPPPIPAPPVAPRKLQVRVSCPKGARPAGCRFALQVVSGKPRKARGKGRGAHAKAIPPTAESAVARVRLGAGKSALVTLTPKPKFAAKLTAASTLLVREAVTANGRATTAYKRLKVISG